MTRLAVVLAIALDMTSTLFLAGVRRAAATPQISTTPIGSTTAERLRFRLVGNEPIAGPDGQSLVNGWTVLVVQDVKTSRCYVMISHDRNESVLGETPCAERPPVR